MNWVSTDVDVRDSQVYSITALAFDIREYNEYLVYNFLSRKDGIEYQNNFIHPALISIGVLAHRGCLVEIASPLIRAALMRSISSCMAKESGWIAVTPKGLVDVPKLLRYFQFTNRKKNHQKQTKHVRWLTLMIQLRAPIRFEFDEGSSQARWQEESND